MKIGFDARPLGDKPAGVGLYILNLVNFLIRKRISCFLFFDKEPVFKLSYSKYLKKVVINRSGEKTTANLLLWEQISLPYALKQHKIDLYHATDSKDAPIDCPCPIVLTVHDLIPWLTPNFFHGVLEKELFYKFSIRNSCQVAKKIICISYYTKKDLINTLGISKYKIKVIHNGIDLHFPKSSQELINKYKKIFGIKNNYIIYIGGISTRKNIEGLIKAFAIIKKLYEDLNLVILGTWYNRYPLLLKKMAVELNIDRNVIFTDYVDDKIKYALISGASMSVYPSFFEGFGLPILESMLCNIPVITSRVTSIPEIAGDAAILINPYDVKTIVNAIDKILSDKNFSKLLVKKGQIRVKKFSSTKMAQETLKVYKEILKP